VPAAVSTYLFNSQLVTLPDGRTALIAPRECEEHDGVRAYVHSLVDGEAPIDEVRYFDLRQSMNGGGGPACLRLRVVLTEREERAIAPGVVFTPALDSKLTAWIERHYRDRLRPGDLADPAFLDESRRALDELTRILELGAIYPFQLS
jgi:succinylarginine dihydrolase